MILILDFVTIPTVAFFDFELFRGSKYHTTPVTNLTGIHFCAYLKTGVSINK
jgi:hypothetical protein